MQLDKVRFVLIKTNLRHASPCTRNANAGLHKQLNNNRMFIYSTVRLKSRGKCDDVITFCDDVCPLCVFLDTTYLRLHFSSILLASIST